MRCKEVAVFTTRATLSRWVRFLKILLMRENVIFAFRNHILDPSHVYPLALLGGVGGLEDFTEVGVWGSQPS